MKTCHALQWELHAPGRHITFSASRDEHGYDLVMRRGDAVLLADVAKDTSTLLEKSARLRTHLQLLGYSPDPREASRLPLVDAACLPARPMEASLLNMLS